MGNFRSIGTRWPVCGAKGRVDLPAGVLKGRDNQDETICAVGGTNELTSPRALCAGLKPTATVEMMKNAEESTRHAAILQLEMRLARGVESLAWQEERGTRWVWWSFGSRRVSWN